MQEIRFVGTKVEIHPFFEAILNGWSGRYLEERHLQEKTSRGEQEIKEYKERAKKIIEENKKLDREYLTEKEQEDEEFMKMHQDDNMSWSNK